MTMVLRPVLRGSGSQTSYEVYREDKPVTTAADPTDSEMFAYVINQADFNQEGRPRDVTVEFKAGTSAGAGTVDVKLNGRIMKAISITSTAYVFSRSFNLSMNAVNRISIHGTVGGGATITCDLVKMTARVVQ